MKITVTPIKGKDLSLINKGDIISFEKSPDEVTSNHIKAYFNGDEIGFVPDTATQLIVGTVKASDMFDDVEDKFNGVVTDIVTKVTTRKKITLEVEVKGSTLSGATSTKSETIFNFKISGSTSANPSKAIVIADVNAGKEAFVTFNLDGDRVVTMYNGKQAGVLSTKNEAGNGTAEERELFKEFLSSTKEIIEGRVSSLAGISAYTVSVSISNSAIEKAKSSGAKKAMSSIKQPLIDMGFDPMVLDNIENYLLECKFSVDNIAEIMSTYTVYSDEVKARIPQAPKILYGDKNNEMMSDAWSIISEDMHVLCSGVKGTGKNVFIETWAWILQRPLYSISINRETDKNDLLGSKTIEPVKVTDPVTGNETYVSKIVFQKEGLLEAMEVGGIINIDEINFADPGVTGVLHSIGDTRKSIDVAGYKYVQGHKNFLMMATMNVGYNGTEDLNEALADRFVDMSFEENEDIIGILEKNCVGALKSNINNCNKVYLKVVNALKDADSSFDDSCLTVRGYIQALKMSKRMPLKRALIRAVADKVRDKEYRQNLVDLIETTVR